MLEGYWISPNGKMVEIPNSHIAYVMKNPEMFGYSLDDLKAIEKEHGDRLEDEGKSRNQVMTDLLKKGWIRVRYDRQREWVLQVWTLSKKIKDNLFDWAYKMIDGAFKGAKKVYKNSGLFLMELKAGNNSVTASFGDILSGKFYETLKQAVADGTLVIEEDLDLEEALKAHVSKDWPLSKARRILEQMK